MKIIMVFPVSSVPMKDLFFGKLIGQGNFGRVHKGIWNGMAVALKRIKIPCASDGSVLPTPKEVEILKLVQCL